MGRTRKSTFLSVIILVLATTVALLGVTAQGEKTYAAENGDDPFVRPDYTALKVILTATDNRAAHAGNQFILAVIYVRVELPLNTFEQQAPGAATIFLFPELQAQTGASNSVTLNPALRDESDED